MRLIVYPHDLRIGGSQINAIDLAAGVAEAGHEVLVYGVPGPLVDHVERRNLPFVPARPLRYRPAPSRVAQLAALCRRHHIDLIHTYEWPPCLDAVLGAHLVSAVPVLCTVLSMHVSDHVPPSIPLVMGTAKLAEQARAHHAAPVWVLEPPIDVVGDHPGIDGSGFRHTLGVADGELLIVSVSRHAIELKLDALVHAIDAADVLAARWPVRLALVGDGEAQQALMARAEQVNRRHGRTIVSLPGASGDPREAYAAADVVVAMGSSALRAMAIGTPVVVQGEQGFSETFEPANLPLFLHQGLHGVGDDKAGTKRLVEQLERPLADADERRRLGVYGRQVVEERFSLARAVDLQLGIYDSVLRSPPQRRPVELAWTLARAARTEVRNHDPARKARQAVERTRRLAAVDAAAVPANAREATP